MRELMHDRAVSSFWTEFDTGWLTPKLNFVLFALSFALCIAAFIMEAVA